VTIKVLLVHFSRTKEDPCGLLTQKGTVLDSGGSQASFAMQAFTLTRRSFINMSRDFGYYWLRLIIYIVVTLCIGTIYLNVGTGYSSILVKFLSTVDTYIVLPLHLTHWKYLLILNPEPNVGALTKLMKTIRLGEHVLLSYLVLSHSCRSEGFHRLSRTWRFVEITNESMTLEKFFRS